MVDNPGINNRIPFEELRGFPRIRGTKGRLVGARPEIDLRGGLKQFVKEVNGPSRFPKVVLCRHLLAGSGWASGSGPIGICGEQTRRHGGGDLTSGRGNVATSYPKVNRG
ncbi:hypothetical protein O5D80_000087 [Batrachochytrium dendrobatidis]|nr:hypothetical protein O5D80_000087 [Batrachochytrium dendrobatidis]